LCVATRRGADSCKGVVMNLGFERGGGCCSFTSVQQTIRSAVVISKTAVLLFRSMAFASLLVIAACSRAPQGPAPSSADREWHEFEGTWTAAGSRHSISLGNDRKASIANLAGSLLLAGSSSPAVGFRAEAIVLNDSGTGMIGRAVWTDERGDQAFSEIRGEGTATRNKIVGTFIGGTGRYSGATGSYQFSWRFVLETEDGTVQGQSIGLKGQVRLGSPQEPSGSGGPRT
jgi:hypothetical protein